MADDMLKGSQFKFFMEHFVKGGAANKQSQQGVKTDPYYYEDVHDNILVTKHITVQYELDSRGNWHPNLSPIQRILLEEAVMRVAQWKRKQSSSGTTTPPPKQGMGAKPPKEIAMSEDLFWQLAGMFGWEGRNLEDVEVTFKLQTNKPVQITVQYKDHGKEMFSGDTGTTTEFALVMEQYDLHVTDRVEEMQKKR